MSEDAVSESSHWASYYRTGALVSCPTNPEPYYSMEIREAWSLFFGALQDGARILDLGTGNGPVALIAKETATRCSRTFQIHGVDLADIDPHRDVPGGDSLLAGISFHAGITTGDLPFASESFDAISGQYILEYTDVAATLREAYRVLRPGGLCQFILHHAGSVIKCNADESLQQSRMIIDETKTVEKFRRYCEAAASNPQQAESARNELYAVGAQLQNAAKASRNPLLLRFAIDSISRMLRNRSRTTAGQLLLETERLERDLGNWTARLDDLIAGALSEADVRSLIAQAEHEGFSLVDWCEQFQNRDKLVGWRLIFSKSDAT